MGCSSSKSTAPKVDDSKTLLTSEATVQKASEGTLQYQVARVTLKPGSAARVVDVVTNPAMKLIFDDVAGLVDVQIMLAANDKMIVQAAMESEKKATTSDSKLDEVLKLFEDLFAADPARFTATGGTVQMAGHFVWSLSCPAFTQHVVLCALTKLDASDRISRLLNSQGVQQQLTEAVGFMGMEAIMAADRKLFLHARFVSKQAFEASEKVLQDVIGTLSDALEENGEQFKAIGGHVKLAGTQLWSFPRLSAVAQDEDVANQQFPNQVEAPVAQEVQELVVEPRTTQTTNAPNSWFFHTCCAPPSVSQA